MVGKTESTNHIWKHASHVVWRKVSGEVVILDMESSVYYSLDEMGARIWELIGQGKPLQEIIQILAEEYEATEERLQRDIGEFLKRLQRERVIEPA
jgi:hypothetical protein